MPVLRLVLEFGIFWGLGFVWGVIFYCELGVMILVVYLTLLYYLMLKKRGSFLYCEI